MLLPARTTPARYRLYSSAEIWRLELVRTLRHVGFGLDEIRGVLAGEVDARTAFVWQLEAIEERLRHLTRLRDILALAWQAHAGSEGDAHSLAYLHDIGAALTRSAEERDRFLGAKLRTAIGGEAIPPGWMERMLGEAGRHLPAEPTPAQAAAWAELVALLSDPAFIAASRAHIAPFWEGMRRAGANWDDWHATMAAISERALAALRDGATPDSAEVQAMARDWAALFARAMGVPCDAAFLARFAAQAGGFVDERSRRVHELMERAGWGGDVPSPLAAHDLLLAGLRVLAAAH